MYWSRCSGDILYIQTTFRAKTCIGKYFKKSTRIPCPDKSREPFQTLAPDFEQGKLPCRSHLSPLCQFIQQPTNFHCLLLPTADILLRGIYLGLWQGCGPLQPRRVCPQG